MPSKPTSQFGEDRRGNWSKLLGLAYFAQEVTDLGIRSVGNENGYAMPLLRVESNFRIRIAAVDLLQTGAAMANVRIVGWL